MKKIKGLLLKDILQSKSYLFIYIFVYVIFAVVGIFLPFLQNQEQNILMIQT